MLSRTEHASLEISQQKCQMRMLSTPTALSRLRNCQSQHKAWKIIKISSKLRREIPNKTFFNVLLIKLENKENRPSQYFPIIF